MSIRRSSMASLQSHIHGNILERVLQDNSGIPPAPGIGKHLSLTRDGDLPPHVHTPMATCHQELDQDSFCLARVVKSNINFQMLPYKLFYLFTDGAMACVVPYRSLFFKQLGMSPSRIGIISASKPFASFVANPLAGVFADRFGKRRLIMVVSILIWITLMVALGFVPPPDDECQKDLTGFSCDNEKNSPFSKRSIVLENQKLTFVSYSMNTSISHIQLFSTRPTISTDINNNNRSTGSNIGAINNSTRIRNNINKASNFSRTLRERRKTFSTKLYPLNLGSELKSQISGGANNRTAIMAVITGTTASPGPGQSTRSEECLIANQSWRYNHESLDSTFIIILVITCATYCAFGPGMRLADTSTLNTLSHSRAKDITDYGWHRSFGGLGWAICSLAVGAILSMYNTESIFCGVNLEITDYKIAFLMFGGVASLALLCSFWMDFGKATGHKWNTQWAELRRLFCNLHYASVLCVAFFVGICNGCTWGFLLWHLQNLGASQFLIGLLEALQSSSELVIGFFCHSILQRLGHVNTLCIGLLLYAARFACYALIANPYWMIPVEIAHGVSFLMTWTTLVSYLASAVSTEGLATAQGVLGAFYFGLGNGLGSFASGLLIDSFGAVTTFASFSVACAVALVFFYFIQKMCPQSDVHEREARRRKNHELTPPTTATQEDTLTGSDEMNAIVQSIDKNITHVTLEDIPDPGSHASSLSDSGVASLQPRHTHENNGLCSTIPDIPRSPRRPGSCKMFLYIPYMDSISTEV